MMTFSTPFTYSPNDIVKTRLVWLNKYNETAKYQFWVLKEVMATFPIDEIIALEIGSPYGGAVEAMAKLLLGRGKAYGYDTFEGHPKDLSDDPNSLEATCMEHWYKKDNLGTDALSYDYQRAVLDEEGLHNAILVKGRLNEHSFDDITKIHFAMLDLDLIKPTVVSYNAIKDKFLKGSYLIFHDALPADHLPLIHDFVYKEVIPSGLWDLVIEDSQASIVGLKRI